MFKTVWKSRVVIMSLLLIVLIVGARAPTDVPVNLGDSVGVSDNLAVNRIRILNLTDSVGVSDSSRSIPARLFEFDWADSDNDNKVTILDISQVAYCFDRTSSSALWPTCKYWDFYLQNRVTILDISVIAFLFDQSSSVSPFPGQGQSPGQMDPIWRNACSALSLPDMNYCNTLP